MSKLAHRLIALGLVASLGACSQEADETDSQTEVQGVGTPPSEVTAPPVDEPAPPTAAVPVAPVVPAAEATPPGTATAPTTAPAQAPSPSAEAQH